jgi:hypothetical protein
MQKEFGKRGRTVATAKAPVRPAPVAGSSESANAFGTLSFVAAAISAVVAVGLIFWVVRHELTKPELAKLESHLAFVAKLRDQRMNELGGDPQPLSSIFMPVAFNSTVTDFMMHAGPDRVLPASVKAALAAMARDAAERITEARANFGSSGPLSVLGPTEMAGVIDNLRRLVRDPGGLCAMANLDWLVDDYRDYSQARDRAVQMMFVVNGEASARSEAARWRSVDVELGGRLRTLSRDGYLTIPAAMRRAAAPILWETRNESPEQDRCSELRAPTGTATFQRPPGSSGFSR